MLCNLSPSLLLVYHQVFVVFNLDVSFTTNENQRGMQPYNPLAHKTSITFHEESEDGRLTRCTRRMKDGEFVRDFRLSTIHQYHYICSFFTYSVDLLTSVKRLQISQYLCQFLRYKLFVKNYDRPYRYLRYFSKI